MNSVSKCCKAVAFEKHKPLTTVDFEQRIDRMKSWINEWNSTERFLFIEKLTTKCDKEQIQLLWTVLQPALHRDFVFSSLSTANTNFQAISTPVSREIHQHARAFRSKGRKVPFLKSAILRNEEDVKNWTSCSVLPIMKSISPTSSFTRPSPRGSPGPSERRSGAWKSQSSYYRVRFPGIRKHHGRTSLSVKSAPPSLGGQQIVHQIRRHMQRNEDLKSEYFNAQSNQLNLRQASKTKLEIVFSCFDQEWNVWQRNEFLQIFLKTLEPSELFYISGLISVRKYRDFVSSLPRQLSRLILSYLTAKELCIISKVSRAWCTVANDEILWKEKCAEIYIAKSLARCTHWKTVYKENLELQQNWIKGRCSFMQLLGHSKRVLSVTAYENLIASGSLDKTIQIWDAKSGKLLQTLHGHSKGVWCLNFLSKALLISGSHDTSIRVWNLRTGILVRFLMSHTGPVWAMQRKDDILVSASGDKTAKVWNIRQCTLLRTLVGHSASVFCIDIDEKNNRALTGSADHTVRIWELESGKCLKYFSIGITGKDTALTSMSYDQGYIAITTGNRVSLWSIEKKKCIKEFHGHEDRVECVKLRVQMVRGQIKRGIIYSGGKDGLIKYWDFRKGICLKTLGDRQSIASSLFIDDFRIISACDDNHVRIWNFGSRRRQKTKRTRQKCQEIA